MTVVNCQSTVTNSESYSHTPARVVENTHSSFTTQSSVPHLETNQDHSHSSFVGQLSDYRTDTHSQSQNQGNSRDIRQRCQPDRENSDPNKTTPLSPSTPNQDPNITIPTTALQNQSFNRPTKPTCIRTLQSTPPSYVFNVTLFSPTLNNSSNNNLGSPTSICIIFCIASCVCLVVLIIGIFIGIYITYKIIYQ